MLKRFHDADGANAVEFALVLPILVILLFGIFTVGQAYNTKLVANHAARDAARFGATLTAVPDGSGGMGQAWFESVRDRAVEASEGEFGTLPSGTFTPRTDALICVGYFDEAAWRSWTWDGTSTSGPNAAACYADTLSDERVQVELIRDASFNIVFLPPDTLELKSDAVARFEDRPSS